MSLAVVNVHYLADQMEQHLAARTRPDRDLRRARRPAGFRRRGEEGAAASSATRPFYVLNADSFWIDGPRPTLLRLAEAFDPARMDMLDARLGHDDGDRYAGRRRFPHESVRRADGGGERQSRPSSMQACSSSRPNCSRHAGRRVLAQSPVRPSRSFRPALRPATGRLLAARGHARIDRTKLNEKIDRVCR